MTERMPETYLFVPANRPDRFEKAMASGADRIILDLEDAVPLDGKDLARSALRDANLDWSRVLVRVNPPSTPFYVKDLMAIAGTKAAGIMIAKSETAADIDAVHQAIGRSIEVTPLIETAKGIDAIDEILCASGVTRVALGHLDMALDLGCSTDWDSLVLIRQKLVWRSRLFDKAAPIEGVTSNIDDNQVFEDTLIAKKFGFGAKLLIHPKQIDPTRRAFAPSVQEVAWASKVLTALEASKGAAVAVDGKMVDKPIEDAARRILMKNQFGVSVLQSK